MSGGYVLIAAILFYIFLLQKIDSLGPSPLKAAALLLSGYYTLLIIAVGLEMTARGESVWQIFDLMFIITLIVQYVVAAWIFYKTEESGDSYMLYIAWGGLGLALIFFLVPNIIRQVFFFLM